MGLGAASIAATSVSKGQDRNAIIGHGDFRYRAVPGWGVLGADTPVNNCHGIVCDREEHIIPLTDHKKNNAIVYDGAGKLVDNGAPRFRARTGSPGLRRKAAR